MMESRRSTFLAVAFVALLLVIGVSTFAVGRSARRAQDRVTALNKSRMESDDALDTLRDNVYLIGIIARDYLLDNDPADAQQYVTQFNTVRSDTETSFQVLASSKEADLPQESLSQLRQEFGAYSDITAVVLGWTPEQRRALGPQMLRERLLRRQEVFALTGQVEKLVTANFEHQGNQITQSDQQLRSSLGWISVVALILGLGISAITLVHTTRLERQSQHAESELRQLSGQLRTAQEQERKNLSRELHDQVGQLLTGLRLELGTIARAVNDAESALRLANAKGTVEQVLRSVRDIAMLLRPSMLDDLGLTPALAWLGREMSRSSGIEIQMEVDEEANSLPDAHRTCLYRIVQEALTNASLHSGARKVQVMLRTGGAWVSGAISDNGRGFVTDPGVHKGLGLLGMQERVRELGGSIRIVSSLGRGTRVEIRLPRPSQPEVLDAKDSDRGRPRNRSDGLEASA
jgi:signal transduction histidine kinase